MATIDDYLNGHSDDTLSEECPKNEHHHNVYTCLECAQDIVHKYIDYATEITITFKPELHNSWLEHTLKEITERTLRKAMKKAPAKASMLLIGEHSPTGLFHYHGIFWGIPNDIVSRIKRACARDLGRTEIKMIRYTETYEKYMFKAYTPMAELPEKYRSYTCININA